MRTLHDAEKPAEVVVLGDSIVRHAPLGHLCGRTTVNAGISSFTASDLVGLARPVLAEAKPKLVIIAVGINDATFARHTDPTAFRAAYGELIALARNAGARVALVTTAPVDPAGLLGRTVDPARRAQIDDAIRSFGLPVVSQSNLGGPDGRLPRTLSEDGLHPNANGYRPWIANLGAACGLMAPAT